MSDLSLPNVRDRFRRASARRRQWESLWRDCFAYALPLRGSGLNTGQGPGRISPETMYDGTAADAVEQLAASLLAQLTPPSSEWFGFKPVPGLEPDVSAHLAPSLDQAAAIALKHFERSNFAVEMHQCFLDLVTVGTATMLFEEAPAGNASAFTFQAVPTAEITIESGAHGCATGHFRTSQLTGSELLARYPEAPIPAPASASDAESFAACRIDVVEAVLPGEGEFSYLAYAENVGGNGSVELARGQFARSPFITFRWLKGAGELYGRSPVMTALPDIKTTNKVVELVLKNASIAVSGIWQLEDDGALNPANIKLVPGAIIPKSPGGGGLTPLASPGRFDVSQLILDDFRARIRRTLMVDQLGPVAGARMTATEVLQRSAEATRLLSAVYGRLQGELINPLLRRAQTILARRGEIPPFRLDGIVADIEHRSPLARLQAREDVQNTLMWLETAQKMGPEALAHVDLGEAITWLGERLGVPDRLVRSSDRLIEGLLGEAIDTLENVTEPDPGPDVMKGGAR
ncbi:MAG: portal protein [Geminicoccaceae bacterium]